MRPIIFFSLVFYTLASTAAVPASGIWWSPTEPGTAYHFQVEQDRVVVNWLVYDEDGAAIWLVGAGRLIAQENGHKLAIRLQHYRNGACPGCLWIAPDAPTDAGDLVLIFTAHGRARATYAGRSKSLQPLVASIPTLDALAEGLLSGRWVLVFEDERQTVTIELGEVLPEICITGQCSFSYPVIASDQPTRELLCIQIFGISSGCTLVFEDRSVVFLNTEDLSYSSIQGFDEGDRPVYGFRLPDQGRQRP